MIKYTGVFLFLFAFTSLQSQPSQVEMADGLRADGKIYVVITVIAIAFAALFGFMAWLDRRLRKAEERMNQIQKPNS